MHGLFRPFVLDSEDSIIGVDNGGLEGEQIRTVSLLLHGVVSGLVGLTEGYFPQPDRSAPDHRCHAMQTHRRQSPFSRNGKRPRDLLNPKAVKYMQSVFSIKDAMTKKESPEISALFDVTVSQVREFITSQRSRVRKFVCLSREKALRSNSSKEVQDGVPVSTDPATPIYPVPLSCVGPASSEERPCCSTQEETLPGLGDSNRHFLENIFSFMRKEETFSGQVKLMEWILQIQNSSVLYWYSSQYLMNMAFCEQTWKI
ncbi:Homeobox protein like [Actinidia chinensis var. chinensis]|uniref:Homeobox protein like n=1 Tax=Actinidia chinensis var. chinensis TaxID=1590841 RepID=A0A2R6S183_ACTCC|nr:Homeobox protein like [Actinidia chinensis var. chinensis]